ncbi:MAG TPA: hypothetical protein PKU97_03400, partial [Kofleriaceae bacterium]|nr:hypothetical protein [Kofleriaceae bacterium]
MIARSDRGEAEGADRQAKDKAQRDEQPAAARRRILLERERRWDPRGRGEQGRGSGRWSERDRDLGCGRWGERGRDLGRGHRRGAAAELQLHELGGAAAAGGARAFADLRGLQLLSAERGAAPGVAG